MKKLCSVIILLSFFVCINQIFAVDEELKKTQEWLKGLGKIYTIEGLKNLKKTKLLTRKC